MGTVSSDGTIQQPDHDLWTAAAEVHQRREPNLVQDIHVNLVPAGLAVNESRVPATALASNIDALP